MKLRGLPAAATANAWNQRGGAAIPGCIAQNISFPAGSAWTLCVKAVPTYGLIISQASFRKSPVSPFIPILSEARLSEIFVVYNPGFPRIADMAETGPVALALSTGSATASDCPAPRVLLDNNRICREIRDSGIAVKDAATVRRGREAVYYSVLGAANYDYIQEWTFRDDGTILARVGATGEKLDGPDDTTGHVHNYFRRLDFDLNGPGGDAVCLDRRFEDLTLPISSAEERCTPIRTEAGLPWNPLQFSALVIADSALKNGRGRTTEYALVPSRPGTSRHSEAFARNDFWVTRFRAGEIAATELPNYANAESTAGQDNVIWYRGSVRHEEHMRDEDRRAVPVIWVGFELQPRNLFDGTPFFP